MAVSPEFYIHDEALQGSVPVRIWPLDGVPDDRPLPLLVVHDGTDYENRAHLTDRLERLVSDGLVMPHRAVLLDPAEGRRLDWYGALPAYHHALANTILPTVRGLVSVEKSVVGLGASLGAVSLLGCELDSPGTFGGLRMQSTSFHHPDFDGGLNRTYTEYDRVAALVDRARDIKPVDITNVLELGITWNPAHKSDRSDALNAWGNTAMSNTLAYLGHNVSGGPVAGGHDFESWGETLEPDLIRIMKECWGSPT